MNTYLYIMELIFIKVSGGLVCDYDTLHNHINAVELSWKFVSIFIQIISKKTRRHVFLWGILPELVLN